MRRWWMVGELGFWWGVCVGLCTMRAVWVVLLCCCGCIYIARSVFKSC